MQELPGTTEKRLDLIAEGALDPKGASQFLNKTFDAKDYLSVLRRYTKQQKYIDGLYEIFCHLDLDPATRKRCFRALRKAGGETKLLPTSYSISFPLEKPDVRPKAFGGYSEVWKVIGPTGTTFALKVIRVSEEDILPKIQKRFCKEVLVAKQVKNDNVMAIVGVQMNDQLCIVSEWMENGHMLTYLQGNEDADRIELLLGVTKGLSYLHSIEVVHGDLKSPNIMIDASGNPRLMDFGISSITRNDFSVNASTPNGSGSTRWQAPELLPLSTKANYRDKVKSVRPTNKSDVYSLAMVMIEIFTGKHPFALHTEQQVILLLAKGSRPDKPVHGQFSPKMWSLTKKCWEKDPKKRPDIPEVLRKLESGDGKKWYGLLSASVSTFLGSRTSLLSGDGSSTIH